MRVALTQIDTPAGPGSVQIERPHRPCGLVLFTRGGEDTATSLELLLARDALVAARFVVGLVTQPHQMPGSGPPTVPARQDEAWLVLVARVRAERGLAELPLIVGGPGDDALVAARTAQPSGAVGLIALDAAGGAAGRPDVAELESMGVAVARVPADRAEQVAATAKSLVERARR